MPVEEPKELIIFLVAIFLCLSTITGEHMIWSKTEFISLVENNIINSVIIIITLNSGALRGGKKKGEEEGNADYGGIVHPSQQHVAPYVEGVEWRLSSKGFR